MVDFRGWWFSWQTDCPLGAGQSTIIVCFQVLLHPLVVHPLLLAIANLAHSGSIGTNNPVWHEGQIRAFCQEGLDREIAQARNLHVTLSVRTAIIRYYKLSKSSAMSGAPRLGVHQSGQWMEWISVGISKYTWYWYNRCNWYWKV